MVESLERGDSQNRDIGAVGNARRTIIGSELDSKEGDRTLLDKLTGKGSSKPRIRHHYFIEALNIVGDPASADIMKQIKVPDKKGNDLQSQEHSRVESICLNKRNPVLAQIEENIKHFEIKQKALTIEFANDTDTTDEEVQARIKKKQESPEYKELESTISSFKALALKVKAPVKGRSLELVKILEKGNYTQDAVPDIRFEYNICMPPELAARLEKLVSVCDINSYSEANLKDLAGILSLDPSKFAIADLKTHIQKGIVSTIEAGRSITEPNRENLNESQVKVQLKLEKIIRKILEIEDAPYREEVNKHLQTLTKEVTCRSELKRLLIALPFLFSHGVNCARSDIMEPALSFLDSDEFKKAEERLAKVEKKLKELKEKPKSENPEAIKARSKAESKLEEAKKKVAEHINKEYIEPERKRIASKDKREKDELEKIVEIASAQTARLTNIDSRNLLIALKFATYTHIHNMKHGSRELIDRASIHSSQRTISKTVLVAKMLEQRRTYQRYCRMGAELELWLNSKENNPIKFFGDRLDPMVRAREETEREVIEEDKLAAVEEAKLIAKEKAEADA